MKTASVASMEKATHNINVTKEWKDVIKDLAQPSFSLEIREMLQPDALQDYQFDASLHFERTSESTYKLNIEPKSIESMHGWECPATLRFIVETLGSRVASACGFGWYRIYAPTNDLAVEQEQIHYLQMLETEDSRVDDPQYNNGQWTELRRVVPTRPEMSRELLRPGFSW